jgi:hypothetical protein
MSTSTTATYTSWSTGLARVVPSYSVSVATRFELFAYFLLSTPMILVAANVSRNIGELFNEIGNKLNKTNFII